MYISLIARLPSTSYFDWINDAGGIYQRQVKPIFFYTPLSEKDPGNSIFQFLTTQDLFALVSCTLPSHSGEVILKIAESGIPSIGCIRGRASAVDLDDHIYYSKESSSGGQGVGGGGCGCN